MARVLGIKGRIAGRERRVQTVECSECCDDQPGNGCCEWVRDPCVAGSERVQGRRGRLTLSMSTTLELLGGVESHAETVAVSCEAVQSPGASCYFSVTTGTFSASVVHVGFGGDDYSGQAEVSLLPGVRNLQVDPGQGIFEIDTNDPEGPQGVGVLFRTGEVFLSEQFGYELAVEGPFHDRYQMLNSTTVYHNLLRCENGTISYDDERGVFTGTITREDYSNVSMSFDYRSQDGSLHIFGSYEASVTFDLCETEGLPSGGLPHSAEIEAYMQRDPLRSCRGCGG